jgi:tetrahydromethanopterin S-methyltransferase subunit B
MSNELQLKRLQSRITSINNVLSDSIETKVSELSQQINELTTKLNDVKINSYYKYNIVAECEGIFNTPGQLLNLSYGSGSPNEDNFAL